MKAFKTAAALAVALLASGAAQAKTIKMEVNGLVCAFCAQGIEKKLKAMAPTQAVFVSLEKKIVAIALKEGQDIPDAQLRESLKDSGYDIQSVQRVDDSLDKIRADAKAKKR